MHETLKKKIDLLTKLTCWDHHKHKDGMYVIECRYDSFCNTLEWGYDHSGYLWDDCEYALSSYSEAEDALERRVDKEILKELKWLEEAAKKPEEYDMIWGNKPDHVKLKAEWIELNCRI